LDSEPHHRELKSDPSKCSRELDLSSLESLNRQFTHWVEEQYNAQLHSVLRMSPLDRFALDRNRVRFLPPNEANDELFFVEEEEFLVLQIRVMHHLGHSKHGPVVNSEALH
jgi:hypothetical protein